MQSDDLWSVPGVDASWCARSVDDGAEVGYHADQLVTPASTMKIQVALAAVSAINAGRLDGTARVWLDAAARTPGPVGMSLLSDPVEMSLRDLLVPMMTISDNVATDALINAVGLDVINSLTADLGLPNTWVTSTLWVMLDEMARDAGFSDYASLVRHAPTVHGPPSEKEVTDRLAESSVLDPVRGSCTTPAEVARLLSMIWTDEAAAPTSCATVRMLMRQQLTRNRIASGFGAEFTVAAKSGGLLGIIRNEAGVVTDSTGRSFAIAVFTRRRPGSTAVARDIDAAIGMLAHRLVTQLQAEAG